MYRKYIPIWKNAIERLQTEGITETLVWIYIFIEIFIALYSQLYCKLHHFLIVSQIWWYKEILVILHHKSCQNRKVQVYYQHSQATWPYQCSSEGYWTNWNWPFCPNCCPKRPDEIDGIFQKMADLGNHTKEKCW